MGSPLLPGYTVVFKLTVTVVGAFLPFQSYLLHCNKFEQKHGECQILMEYLQAEINEQNSKLMYVSYQ